MQQAQFAQERAMMDLQNQYQKQNQPSFLQSLAPGLISGGAALYGAKLGAPKITNNYGW